jgi:hypothetical protein
VQRPSHNDREPRQPEEPLGRSAKQLILRGVHGEVVVAHLERHRETEVLAHLVGLADPTADDGQALLNRSVALK